MCEQLGHPGTYPIMAPTSKTTAAFAVVAIRKQLERGGEADPWPVLVAAIRHLHAALEVENPTVPERTLDRDKAAPTGAVRAFLATPPETTGDPRWDTLLHGQIGRELRLRGVERPSWCKPRPLADDWYPLGQTHEVHHRTSTDLWFLRVFVDDSAFDAARSPGCRS